MIAGTLRSHPRPGSNSSGAVVPVALRGRDDGSQAECGEPGDPAFTVRTPAGGSSYPMIAQPTAVRRLTPVECERLQGFDDDWTRWLDDGAEQSDSARYRECGNSLALPVVEWIARRIAAVDQAARSITPMTRAGGAA
jgi:DNA (cytosine-5)-methyltransferase 1